MKVGYSNVNFGPHATAEGLIQVATLAEEAGFDSVWVGDHVVLPDPQQPPSPLPPDYNIMDPLIALSWIAAATSTILLGTGVLVLPQRNPLVLAKQAASIDQFSNGRLIVGVGPGYLEVEMAALGVDFKRRGAITDEYLGVMRMLWEQDRVRHTGETLQIHEVSAAPKPVQRPLPIVIGGHSDAALRRAVERGSGWFGHSITPDETRILLDRLAKAGTQFERPADLGALEITITPRGRLTQDKAHAFAELGVHRIVPLVDPRVEPLQHIESTLKAMTGV